MCVCVHGVIPPALADPRFVDSHWSITNTILVLWPLNVSYVYLALKGCLVNTAWPFFYLTGTMYRNPKEIPSCTDLRVFTVQKNWIKL